MTASRDPKEEVRTEPEIPEPEPRLPKEVPIHLSPCAQEPCLGALRAYYLATRHLQDAIQRVKSAQNQLNESMWQMAGGGGASLGGAGLLRGGSKVVGGAVALLGVGAMFIGGAIFLIAYLHYREYQRQLEEARKQCGQQKHIWEQAKDHVMDVCPPVECWPTFPNLTCP